MSRILRSTDIKSALRSRQRGFLLNPFRFGSAAITYNSFQASPVPGGTTSGTLSNSNRTWTTNTPVGSGNLNANYVTPIGSVASGKKAYWEMQVTQLSPANTGYVYFNVHGSYIWYVYGNVRQIVGTNTTNISAGTNGMRLMFAVDGTAGKTWYGRDGSWISTGTGTPDPAAGTGPAHTFTPGTGLILIEGRTGTSAQIVTYNPGNVAFTYTPPTGFSSINA